jgi:phosphopantothenoylcysteine decarboxylase/phosphopantothenate--cysteine ligase
MAKIALGVTASVSIYKACEILRGFQKAGCEVQVVMTRNAAELVSPRLFTSLSGLKTIVNMFEDDLPWSVAHVALAKDISLFVVAPATANILGKLASGVADDFLSTLYLASDVPVLVAPAMNETMFLHPRTQENIRKLRSSGVEFVEPDEGYLACGDEGRGRLAPPETIVRRGLELLRKTTSLKGKTVLVTAGPTREYLDPVRFLSNRSSGKMGYEIAREALVRGGRVILISGPSDVFPPPKAEFVRVETAAEMEKEVFRRLPEARIVVMAAAVADFRFASPDAQKIKKSALPESLELEATPDILKKIGEKKKNRFIVGFAAETDDLKANALRKIRAKHLDLVIANDVSRQGIGFESDENQVLIADGKGRVAETPVLTKRELARVIWDAIESALGKRRG